MKKWLAIIVALGLMVSPVGLGAQDAKKKAGAGGTKRKFLSLRVLQQRLQAVKPNEPYPAELLELAGLKRIIGYVVDEKNHDLILAGQTNPTLPPLHLDDLVVAWRNVNMKYVREEGKKRYYSDPGCSIDPTPEVLAKAKKYEEQEPRQAPFAEKKAWTEGYLRIWTEPQQVRVMGIPFDSRFAWVMVAADYEMKKLADNAEKLKVPGFVSMTDLLRQQRKKALQSKGVSDSTSILSRFWFHPGDNHYKEDKGVVIIERCQVKLLTEEEHQSQTGELVGTGRPHPMAQEFAQRFTERYDKVAKLRPIYTELENLFRFVALAQIMKFKSAEAEAGLDLSYLLETQPMAQVKVDRTLPGCASMWEYKVRRPVPGGYQIYQGVITSCGGVGIELKVAPDNFSPDTTGKLAVAKQSVLAARPSPEALAWEAVAEWEALLRDAT
jgi:hypothetical protein